MSTPPEESTGGAEEPAAVAAETAPGAPAPAEPETAGAGHHPPAHPQGTYLAALSLAALGVVYGDIGTSPLYAIREVFLEEHNVAVTPANILGVLSLVFWALII